MYIVTKAKIRIENKTRTVYGIRNNECFAEDISADRNVVEQLVKYFNKYDLYPIHLYDELEDFLCDF